MLLLLLCMMLAGCSLVCSNKELSLSISGIPSGLIPSLVGDWRVVQCSLSGDISTTELDLAAELPDTIVLEVQKEEDLLLLLYPPPFIEGCGINPLGAYIPSYKDSGTFSPAKGSAVSILFTLINNDLNIEDFNCSRFLLEMSRLDDPWLVEKQILLKQLGRREMRSWYIREKTVFDVSLSLPTGRWYSPSLVQDVLESSGSGSINTVELELPEGYSFLYCPDRKEIMEIQVDSYGEAVGITKSLQ